jgi:hypothetical protein
LAERRKALESKLLETRERLQKVQSGADAKTSAAKAKLSEFQAAVSAADQQRAGAVTAHAEALHKALRAARRAWVRSGRMTELQPAVAAACEAYADACAEPNRIASEALREAAKRFGTMIPVVQPERSDLRPAVIAPLDRIERALGGSAGVVRRMMWKRWYLPGLTDLERIGIGGDIAAQGTRFEQAAKNAEAVVRGVLDGRLADIARIAQAEMERIRVETDFLAEEAEFKALSDHLPALSAQRDRIEEIGKEARALSA